MDQEQLQSLADELQVVVDGAPADMGRVEVQRLSEGLYQYNIQVHGEPQAEPIYVRL